MSHENGTRDATLELSLTRLAVELSLLAWCVVNILVAV